eukprot:CAMPEP_0173418700 /NCGR_PEP_ID=MMETSP1357-20121228/778_1 /TAXON_ID=77926 /ORGANISM="Hemiselmis rufescens, Strain PCC563" /LENGTH=346 /DNA_ID=CAMNT_0014381237 /DNA_START=43 /DNA_END=1079 /DNA_ORIENTATION=-
MTASCATSTSGPPSDAEDPCSDVSPGSGAAFGASAKSLAPQTRSTAHKKSTGALQIHDSCAVVPPHQVDEKHQGNAEVQGSGAGVATRMDCILAGTAVTRDLVLRHDAQRRWEEDDEYQGVQAYAHHVVDLQGDGLCRDVEVDEIGRLPLRQGERKLPSDDAKVPAVQQVGQEHAPDVQQHKGCHGGAVPGVCLLQAPAVVVKGHPPAEAGRRQPQVEVAHAEEELQVGPSQDVPPAGASKDVIEPHRRGALPHLHPLGPLAEPVELARYGEEDGQDAHRGQEGTVPDHAPASNLHEVFEGPQDLPTILWSHAVCRSISSVAGSTDRGGPVLLHVGNNGEASQRGW